MQVDVQQFVPLLIVLALIVLDVASGAILAISRREFDVRKLPDFLRQSVLPYVGGLVILAVGSTFSPEVNALYVASVAAASGKFLAEIKDKWTGLFGNTQG